MGRKLMRVPMTFDWPKGEVWHGYLTPEELFPPACTACDYNGNGPCGYSPEANAVAEAFYNFGGNPKFAWRDKLGQAEVDNLVAEHRLGETVEDDSERGWHWIYPPRTAAEINAKNRPGALGFGHDAINRMILVKFRCEQLGIPVNCPVCDGHGDTGIPEQREAYENYEGPEPPEGEGYQLWETTSEGSPQTPVFATMEELCDYAAKHCTVFADSKVSAEEWREMLDEDFVRVEMVSDAGERIVLI